MQISIEGFGLIKVAAIVTPLLLMAIVNVAFAEPSLKSYRADYQVRYDGIPFGKSTTIVNIHRHQYSMCIMNVTTIPFLKGNVTECSKGSLIKNKIQPQDYNYHYQYNKEQQTIAIHFDWKNQLALMLVNGTRWQMSIPKNTQDKISYQLALRQALAQKQTHFTFPVADGGKMKIYQFRVINKEHIETPLQSFDTIEIQRLPMPGKEAVSIWMAPILNNIPVRVEQQKHIMDTGIAEITHYYAQV